MSSTSERLAPHLKPASLSSSPGVTAKTQRKTAKSAATQSTRKRRPLGEKQEKRVSADDERPGTLSGGCRVEQKDIRQYFPVSSRRQTSSQKQKLREDAILECVKSGCDPKGLEVFDAAEKGRGVRAVKTFHRNDFICEYAGEVMSEDEGREREAKYDAAPEEFGSYVFYFRHHDQRYCVDATKENDRLGRLINHSKKHANIVPRSIGLADSARLVFYALRTINPSEELLYDYGDRSKISVTENPWLKS